MMRGRWGRCSPETPRTSLHHSETEGLTNAVKCANLMSACSTVPFFLNTGNIQFFSTFRH